MGELISVPPVPGIEFGDIDNPGANGILVPLPGAKGAQGDIGPQGPPGRAVTDISAAGNKLTFTMSEGAPYEATVPALDDAAAQAAKAKESADAAKGSEDASKGLRDESEKFRNEAKEFRDEAEAIVGDVPGATKTSVGGIMIPGDAPGVIGGDYKKPTVTGWDKVLTSDKPVTKDELAEEIQKSLGTVESFTELGKAFVTSPDQDTARAYIGAITGKYDTNLVTLWVGTQADFEAIDPKDPNTLYFRIEPEQRTVESPPQEPIAGQPAAPLTNPPEGEPAPEGEQPAEDKPADDTAPAEDKPADSEQSG